MGLDIIAGAKKKQQNIQNEVKQTKNDNMHNNFPRIGWQFGIEHWKWVRESQSGINPAKV